VDGRIAGVRLENSNRNYFLARLKGSNSKPTTIFFANNRVPLFVGLIAPKGLSIVEYVSLYSLTGSRNTFETIVKLHDR
jgi:hypothetical protein